MVGRSGSQLVKKMTDQITKEIFQHLVDLAALDLEPDEAEYLRGQLNNQLRAIHELAAIPLPADTPPAARGVPYTPENSQPLREDVWLPSQDAAAILSQTPQTEDGFIVVPDIPHTTLE